MAQLGVRQGACDNRGGEFEVKILTLLFVRAQNQRLQFRLTRNLEQCGIWDDVVFQVKNGTTYFLQLKHRTNRLNLSMKSFLNNQEDFDLKKCFQSYCQVRNNIINRAPHDIFKNVSLDSIHFILYTNGVFQTKHTLNQDTKAGNHILNSSAQNGYIFSFDRKCATDEKVHNFFNELELCSQQLSKITTENATSESDIKYRVKSLKNGIQSGTIKYELDSLLKKPTKEKMKEVLKNLGDVKNIEEFLQKFSVMHGQCSVNELEKVIKKEIEEMFGTGNRETNSLYHEVKSYIKKWWKCETPDTILDENSEFWKVIVRARTVRVAKFSGDVKWQLIFQDVSVIKEKIPKDGSIIVSTECVSITYVKLKQALQGSTSMFVDMTTLRDLPEEITTLWPTYWCEVLLVQCVNARSVFEFFGWNARGTLIIICNSEIKVAFNDTTLLSDLDHHSQNVIFQQKVEFQGHAVEFGSLLKNIKLFDKVNGAVIEQCLEGQLQVGRELNTGDPHFIQRTLSNECGSNGNDFGMNVLIIGETAFPQMDFGFLNKSYNDMTFLEQFYSIYLFLSISYCQQLIKRRLPLEWPENIYIKQKYMQLHKDVLLIVITFEGSLNQIVEAIYESFPDLEIKWFNRNKIYPFPIWVQIKPDRMPEARKFKLQADSFETLLNLQKERVAFLVAEPGMGKSTYLTQLARIFKESSPITWVVHIRWNHYNELLNEMGNTVDKQRTIDFFWRAYSAGCQHSAFEEVSFKCSLEEGSPPVALLLDAFDEVCPRYAEKAATMIEILCSETRVEKLWISTRPMVKHMLPQNLHAVCVVLKPFNKNESEEMLCKLLREKSKGVCQLIKEIPEPELDDIRKNYKLLEYKQYALQPFAFEIVHHTEIPFDFLRMPLHVCMLSVVMEKFMVVSYCDNCMYLPRKLNFLHLYEKFIDIKMDIYVVEKMLGTQSNSKAEIEYDEMKTKVMDTHLIVALYTLFSPKFLQKFSDKEIEVKALHLLRNFEGKESKGIIAQVFGRAAHFVHHTYAEYFAAHWFARNFKDNICVLQEVLFQKEYHYLAQMFDRILCKNFVLHEAVMNLAKNDIAELSSNSGLLNSVDRGGRTPLHLAVIHGSQRNFFPLEILFAIKHAFPADVFIDKGAELHVPDYVLRYTPIKYAYMCCNWRAVNSLLSAMGIDIPVSFLSTLQDYGSFIVCHTSCLPGVSRSALNTAVTFGDLFKVKELIEAGEDVNFQEEPGLTPLHLAALFGHHKMMKYLIEDYKADMNVQHHKLGTPLEVKVLCSSMIGTGMGLI